MNIKKKFPNVFKELSRQCGARKAVKMVRSWEVWGGTDHVFYPNKDE
jgi:hypothetical protein